MQCILLVLIFLLSACSVKTAQSDKKAGVSVPDNPPRLTDEGKFIHDDSFRSRILQSCDPKQTFLRRTSYGSWYKLKDCELKLHGISINKKEISIHKNANKIIDGLRFMVHPDTKYGQYLKEKYQQYSVETEPGICIQYYHSSFPILTIADESLCDAIRYRQI